MVAALAHSTAPYRFAARNCDLVYVTPQDGRQAGAIVAEILGEAAAWGRPAESLRILADLVVFVDRSRAARGGPQSPPR